MLETCFCTQCGQKVPVNINFCPYCGNWLAASHSTALNPAKKAAATNNVQQSKPVPENLFYVFAVQGPALGMAPGGDIVLEKAQKLRDEYEPAKGMPLKLIRPAMWNAHVQSSSTSGMISVSYSMDSFKNEIRSYLKQENIPGELIEKGIALSDENSLQLSNPMSGLFVMGIPIIRETMPPKEQQAAAAERAPAAKEPVSVADGTATISASDAPATKKPAECIHEYKHFVCIKCGAKAPKPSLTALGTKTQNQYTYEYYRASCSEEARYFLDQTYITLPLYYVMVETPEGKWGRDKDGIFLERLCDFQRNLSLAQCEAKTALFPQRMEDVQMAANKITDNFLLSVTCGSCGYEWTDGVAYRSKIVVKCPECGKYNLADTENIRFNNL